MGCALLHPSCSRAKLRMVHRYEIISRPLVHLFWRGRASNRQGLPNWPAAAAAASAAAVSYHSDLMAGGWVSLTGFRLPCPRAAMITRPYPRFWPPATRFLSLPDRGRRRSAQMPSTMSEVVQRFAATTRAQSPAATRQNPCPHSGVRRVRNWCDFPAAYAPFNTSQAAERAGC